MSNQLPEIVTKYRQLLGNANSTGSRLILMKAILDQLETSEETEAIIIAFDEEIATKRESARQLFRDSLNWINDKILVLKKSKWIGHPSIQRKMKALESFINCKPFEKGDDYLALLCAPYPVTGVLGQLLNVLFVVSNELAQLGEIVIFSGWAELKNIQEPEQNKLDRFILPPNLINSILGPYMPTWDWEELSNKEPIHLYEFIKLLGEYEIYKSQPYTEKVPKTLEEYEFLLAERKISEYLKSFSPSYSKISPQSSEEILKLMDRLLNWIEIRLKSKKPLTKRSRSNSNAKKFVRDHILGFLEGASVKQFPRITNQKTAKKVHADILQAAQKLDAPFLSYLTKSCVAEQYRKILKQKGYVRKGGAPQQK